MSGVGPTRLLRPSLTRHPGKIFLAAFLLAVLPLAGCGTESDAPKGVVQDEPEAVAPAAWVQGKGRGIPPKDMGAGQARLAAERAARLAALQDASQKAVEAGGSSVVANFEIVSTTWDKDGTVEVTVKVPVRKK